MKEFKGLSFVMFSADGKPHRVAIDKLEGEVATMKLRGDPALLLKRWSMMDQLVRAYLQTEVRKNETR